MTEEEVAEKMAIYDKLCEEASQYAHLCDFKDGVCARGGQSCCILQPGERRDACDQLDRANGCRITSLPCKIWFCGFLRDLHPELDAKIAEWKEKASLLPHMLFFQSRTDYENSLRGS